VRDGLMLKHLPGLSVVTKIHSKEFANRSLPTAGDGLDRLCFSTFNGLIPSHLALKVPPQETHSIVLKKKVTTTY
jgi:hypothetical protein